MPPGVIVDPPHSLKPTEECALDQVLCIATLHFPILVTTICIFRATFFFFNCLISPLWNTISPTKFSSRTYFVFCNGTCFCFNTLVISRLWIIFFQYSINLLCFMSAKLWFCWYYSLDHFFVFCFFPPSYCWSYS